MEIFFNQNNSVEEFEKTVRSLENNSDIKSIIIFSGDANGFTEENLDPILKALKKPVIGGIFPQIVFKDMNYEKGTIFLGLKEELTVRIINGLSNSETDFEVELSEKVTESDIQSTCFVFVDGLAKRIGEFVESMFNVLGTSSKYIGGGAGSLSFIQKPVLMTNEGMIVDAAVMGYSKNTCSIGVNHGWNELSGPYQVSGSDGNLVMTLDGKPAFDLYQSVIFNHSGKEIRKDNFFDISKSYPFGISKFDSEKIIRDPIALSDDGNIICVGNVPVGSFIYIMTGTNDSLITAASNAREMALNSLEGRSIGTLLIDCISRALYLGKEFNKELKAVSDSGTPIVGALTLGEIANSGKEYLEFYNKTCVVGMLG